MIRKVALVQALREAFPKSFGGMYIAEEQGTVEPDLTVSDVVEMQEAQAIAEKEQPEPVQAAEAPQDAQAALFGNKQ